MAGVKMTMVQAKSWQHKAYQEGYNAHVPRETMAAIIPVYSAIYKKFLGFEIVNVETLEPLFDKLIHRRTHARNWAKRNGYELR